VVWLQGPCAGVGELDLRAGAAALSPEVDLQSGERLRVRCKVETDSVAAVVAGLKNRRRPSRSAVDDLAVAADSAGCGRINDVSAAAAAEAIVSGTAGELVVAGAAEETVGSRAARDARWTRSAGGAVGTASAGEQVVAVQAFDRVATAVAAQQVVAVRAFDEM